MEQVSSLITQKLKVIAEDHCPLEYKHEAVAALLPYAVCQEKYGQPEMLDTLLCAVRASRSRWFTWWYPITLLSTRLSEASPRAIALASPYIDRHYLAGIEDLVQWWVVGVSTVMYTEEVAQGVVDALLQIASGNTLVSHIPVDIWWWLTKQPSLPPNCEGRYYGTSGSVVGVVRGLNNIEVLKSYLLVVWSEWDALQSSGFGEIRTSIREDFSGTGMEHHREDLTRRLNYVLGQLNYGLYHFKQHDPRCGEGDLRKRKQQYTELKEELLEVERCTSSPMIMSFCMLTLADMYGTLYGIQCVLPLPCKQLRRRCLWSKFHLPASIRTDLDLSRVLAGTHRAFLVGLLRLFS